SHWSGPFRIWDCRYVVFCHYLPAQSNQAGFLTLPGSTPIGVFMLRCGATFDENCAPLWDKGDFRGGSTREQTLFGAATKGIFTTFPPSEARAEIQSSKEPRSGLARVQV